MKLLTVGLAYARPPRSLPATCLPPTDPRRLIVAVVPPDTCDSPRSLAAHTIQVEEEMAGEERLKSPRGRLAMFAYSRPSNGTTIPRNRVDTYVLFPICFDTID